MLFPVKVIYHIITSTIPRKIFQLRKAKYLRQEQSVNHGGKYNFSQVSHYYGSNAGDTVLSKCVRMCFGKFFDVKGWNMIFTHDHVSSDTINRINHTDMLVIGGGGLFMRHPASIERLIEGYGISSWQWGIYAENLARINVPVAVFSCGYNYFRGAKETDLFQQSL